MAITNHERVGRTMDLLRKGLAPFVERELKARIEPDRIPSSLVDFMRDPLNKDRPVSEWDTAALLKVMWDTWNEVFRDTLGPTERSLVSELRGHRNNWAHQRNFSSDDTYRALDSSHRLLLAVSAPEADELDQLKNELLRRKYDEQSRQQRRRAAATAVEGVSSSLGPWREVITPHPDVTSGKFQQAEFAADLWQVYLGRGSDEYRDPVEFYRRTYLTGSLSQLLINAIRRLSGQGGDPVVQLQTNFGGGKTHSMLALFHLLSGQDPQQLQGIEDLLADLKDNELPTAKRVVLVGNKISPGQPDKKSDGTEVHTLWGELAWQLGGREAYERIRHDDERATNPGDKLRELFIDYGPCLILIDEWVAYARQLHDDDALPGGSFDTQFTFAQALTESAKLAENCLLVVSLPASDGTSDHTGIEDVEVGGARGRTALDRLQNVVGRVATTWRPASAEEGFEIVRRRLFQPITAQELFKVRDLTARAFVDLYREQPQEFPQETREAEYERRIQDAYPIHPEVFERLYSDWSTLVRFQRTRGVLRLMATVIHALWEAGDRNPLILPATIPIDDPRVHDELTRYLNDNWTPIISRDIDGSESLPALIDAEVPNLGRVHATRRVARTIYLGSAPTYQSPNKGLEDRRIRLGAVMPGESTSLFGDAIRRLASRATYLFQDGNRYWYSTQPTVTKLAEDRADQLRREPDQVRQELDSRLRRDLAQRGDFNRVHALPISDADIPDDTDTRLVVLGLDYGHTRDSESTALQASASILERRGTAPRVNRNTLVFLAADNGRLQELLEATRNYLAWQSIIDEYDQLNLTSSQVRQAKQQMESADSTVTARIPETYRWLLVPTQADPRATVTFQALQLQGNSSLAERASRRLIREELLVTTLGPNRLRLELDRIPLWRGDHVPIAQVIDYFAQYLYLPRVSTPKVVIDSISNGLSLLTWEHDSFAYAESFDADKCRYRGIQIGRDVAGLNTDTGLLVKPQAATAQLDREQPPTGTTAVDSTPAGVGTAVTLDPQSAPPPNAQQADGKPPGRPMPQRFYGNVSLDQTRVGRDAGRIAEELIAHLNALDGASVSVTLEITAQVPSGVPESIVRIVTENANALKFGQHGFEEE